MHQTFPRRHCQRCADHEILICVIPRSLTKDSRPQSILICNLECAVSPHLNVSLYYTHSQGHPSWGGGEMTHVASLKFQGGESLEILYNVMQQPVGHDQRAYIALACCDNPTERGYFCQMITHRTSYFHSAARTLVEIRKLQFTVKKSGS